MKRLEHNHCITYRYINRHTLSYTINLHVVPLIALRVVFPAAASHSKTRPVNLLKQSKLDLVHIRLSHLFHKRLRIVNLRACQYRIVFSCAVKGVAKSTVSILSKLL